MVAVGVIQRQGRLGASVSAQSHLGHHPASAGPRGEVAVLSHLQVLAVGTQMSETHQGMNMQHFLIQGVVSDVHTASSGPFSLSHWAREGDMG